MNTRRLSATFLLVSVLCATARVQAEDGILFSQLPAGQQRQIRKLVEPPPLSERRGCYSTPMYYLMHAGYEYNGAEDKGPQNRCYIKDAPGPDYGSWKLDRNRPDWQEVMLADFADLGLNSTHINIYPINGSLELSPDYLRAIDDYAALSAKYGLKIGVRLNALGGTEAWEMNPSNPDNQIEKYLNWVKVIATHLRGRTQYYILGDELTLHEPSATMPAHAWTPDAYLAYFKRVASAVKEADQSAKVSMFAASSGEWFNVLYLLKHDYAQWGDAVAINSPNYTAAAGLFADARKLAPGLMFVSNGVGYCSAGTVSPRYPQGDPYSKYPTEEAHAAAVAKAMFAWWDVGSSAAPYYITLRNWVRDGRTYPRWFGLFGIEDYVVQNDRLTVKRFPAWYALQTITNTFFDRDAFIQSRIAIRTSAPMSLLRAYEHRLNDRGGSELLLICWNDEIEKPARTQFTVESAEYRLAVQVNLLDMQSWSDVPCKITNNQLTFELPVGSDPVIMRLIRTSSQSGGR